MSELKKVKVGPVSVNFCHVRFTKMLQGDDYTSFTSSVIDAAVSTNKCVSNENLCIVVQ